MKTREIAHDEWSEFFDRVSGSLQGKKILIEVDAPDLGAQIEASQLSLNGLSYDRKGDVFIISTEDIEHRVHQPQKIFVSGDEDGFDGLQITTDEGAAHIIGFSEPLALPLMPTTPASRSRVGHMG